MQLPTEQLTYPWRIYSEITGAWNAYYNIYKHLLNKHIYMQLSNLSLQCVES